VCGGNKTYTTDGDVIFFVIMGICSCLKQEILRKIENTETGALFDEMCVVSKVKILAVEKPTSKPNHGGQKFLTSLSNHHVFFDEPPRP
jgi:hypothetical protein